MPVLPQKQTAVLSIDINTGGGIGSVPRKYQPHRALSVSYLLFQLTVGISPGLIC